MSAKLFIEIAISAAMLGLGFAIFSAFFGDDL